MSVDHSRASMAGNASALGAPSGARPPSLGHAGSTAQQLLDTALLPAPGEELWVIERKSSEPVESSDRPGSGALLAVLPGEETEIPIPLKHTDVKATINGYIATVQVVQQFHNPYEGKIEAVYVFPLPQNAAINEFLMVIGERRIRGVIRERKEATQIYLAARAQGHIASLLTQERPNIFAQRVANIEPGKQIDVNITYFHTLAYDDGWYEFVFPMVVGPRFNPPNSTAGVGAVARGIPGRSGQETEVQYLAPSERTAHKISLKVDLDVGVAVEAVESRNHRLEPLAGTPLHRTVVLSGDDALPNKDFVLRYRVAGDRIKSTLLTHRDERGGYFSLLLFPPAATDSMERVPMEMIFVLDCSGSMSGKPIAQAKAAVERGLRRLRVGDSFQIINFSTRASQLGPRPLEATSANVQRGLDYLSAIQSEGGTMMIEGIKAALDFPHDSERLRFVTFLTDGFIGNEIEILGEMRRRMADSRVFSFGVGSAPNRYLLDRMAKLGRGAVAYLSLNDDAGRIMDGFFDRISHPALTEMEVDWGGLKVEERFPQELPDLFVGRPIVLTGRFTGAVPPFVRVRGKRAGQPIEINVPMNSVEGASYAGLPSIWARMKIADLADHATFQPNPELPDLVRQLALDYNLMSSFTAFVAVDSSRQTAGSEGTTVVVPVPMPDGVKYETTVGE